ncbi:MAG: LuxR C-terminal-related transcriptional regulator [candidate division Zixibacteria bacterium]|nr:LuxR C-terminal-related transcriptional regulator [candidate division Zixibacteria bacterium]
MSKKVDNIIIVETSDIIYEGIFSILTNTGQPYKIHLADNLRELEQLNIRTKADLVFINPVLIQNQLKDFHSLKKELNDTRWIGIVYTYFDQQLLSIFDEIIYINDTPDKIITSVQKFFSEQNPGNQNQQQKTLSEREIDVLKLLVSGNANKEIADKLNISTHTVISHRKKISQKTGIKSVSGLTIYAVVNSIISINDYRE